MHFWRVYRAPLFFMAVLSLGAVLVVRQYLQNEEHHLRMREDMILLQQRGQAKQAEWYYQRLVNELDELSERALLDDYHRTLHLVNPDEKQLNNLIWKYYWAVRNKLERRAQTRVEQLLVPKEEPAAEP